VCVMQYHALCSESWVVGRGEWRKAMMALPQTWGCLEVAASYTAWILHPIGCTEGHGEAGWEENVCLEMFGALLCSESLRE